MIRDALLICDTNAAKASAATTQSTNCIDLKKSRAFAPGDPIQGVAGWTFTSGTGVSVRLQIVAATNADLTTGAVILADSGAVTASASATPVMTKCGCVAPVDGKFTHVGLQYIVAGTTPSVTITEASLIPAVPSNYPANLP